MQDNRYATIDVTTCKENEPFVVMKDVYVLCKDGNLNQAICFYDSIRHHKSKELIEVIKPITEAHTGWNIEVIFMPIIYKPYTSACTQCGNK